MSDSLAQRFGLEGRVSVVTGATGHLGRALCEGLAEAGSDLAVCSRSVARASEFSSRLERIYGIRAHGFAADLSKFEQIPPLIGAIESHFGRVDCLVNNAYFGAANSLTGMSVDEWLTGLNGAVSSAMFMLQASLPLLEASRGSVINIGSMYGVVSPNPDLYEGTAFGNPSNYGAGKAALLQLTRYAASYLGDKGIRVNAISPGPFPAPEAQRSADFVGRLAAKVPLKRIGHPEELKGSVVFLASTASSYITGHNLIVDGGWTIW